MDREWEWELGYEIGIRDRVLGLGLRDLGCGLGKGILDWN